MNKLASVALMSCFATGAIANDTKLIGEAYKEFGDIVFAPVKISTYSDEKVDFRDGESLLKVFGTMIADTGWFVYAYGESEFHKKIVQSKSIVENATARVISNEDIDSILAKVENAGIQGNRRLYLVLDSLEYSRHTITSTVYISQKIGKVSVQTPTKVTTTHIDQQINQKVLSSESVDQFVQDVNRPAPPATSILHTEATIAKEVTKEELERALQAMANNNIKLHNAKLGNVKMHGLRVAGSAVVVYITLDMIHSFYRDEF